MFRVILNIFYSICVFFKCPLSTRFFSLKTIKIWRIDSIHLFLGHSLQHSTAQQSTAVITATSTNAKLTYQLSFIITSQDKYNDVKRVEIYLQQVAKLRVNKQQSLLWNNKRVTCFAHLVTYFTPWFFSVHQCRYIIKKTIMKRFF